MQGKPALCQVHQVRRASQCPGCGAQMVRRYARVAWVGAVEATRVCVATSPGYFSHPNGSCPCHLPYGRCYPAAERRLTSSGAWRGSCPSTSEGVLGAGSCGGLPPRAHT